MSVLADLNKNCVQVCPTSRIGRGVFVIPCACGFGDEVVLAFVAPVGLVDQGDVMLQTWRTFRDEGLRWRDCGMDVARFSGWYVEGGSGAKSGSPTRT